MRLHRSAFAFALALGVAVDCGLWSAALAAPAAPAVGRIMPLATKAGLIRPKAEQAVRLANARVVLADYDLIKHDFGDTLAEHFGKPLAQISNEEVDSWLLDATAYVSRAQAAQSNVNTEIATTGREVTAYRPHDYGRALVFEPKPGVLIDVKGSGAKKPKQKDHANGLASLGESIREYAYEKLVHKIFQHSKSGFRTVGHYAVIDAGFDVKWSGGNTDRAGLILRQAHERTTNSQSLLSSKEMKHVENTLRRYGVTSAGAYNEGFAFDSINIQGTRDGAILDFGGFLAMDRFVKPAYHFAHSPDSDTPRHPLLNPVSTRFVQPDPALRVPQSMWGYSVRGLADPTFDNPMVWSTELGNSLGRGQAQRQDAENHMHHLMDEVDAKLKN